MKTRSIEACFVHSGLNTGPVVQGVFRVEGENVLKRFVARNLRPIFPVAWNHTLGADVFMKFDNQTIEDLDSRPEAICENLTTRHYKYLHKVRSALLASASNKNQKHTKPRQT